MTLSVPRGAEHDREVRCGGRDLHLMCVGRVAAAQAPCPGDVDNSSRKQLEPDYTLTSFTGTASSITAGRSGVLQGAGTAFTLSLSCRIQVGGRGTGRLKHLPARCRPLGRKLFKNFMGHSGRTAMLLALRDI